MGQASLPSRVVEAERYLLRDALGNLRGDWGVKDDGRVSLVLFDEDQRERMGLILDRQGTGLFLASSRSETAARRWARIPRVSGACVPGVAAPRRPASRSTQLQGLPTAFSEGSFSDFPDPVPGPIYGFEIQIHQRIGDEDDSLDTALLEPAQAHLAL